MDKRFCLKLFRITAALAMGATMLVFLSPAGNACYSEIPQSIMIPEESVKAASADKTTIDSVTTDQPFAPAGSTLTIMGGTPLIESTAPSKKGIDWSALLLQSASFLAVEQGYRLMTQPGTRKALKGKFFDDWFESVKATKGWGDGDDFMTNYIGHPMQGAVVSYIFVHNDPRGRDQVFGWNSAYWKSRLKATAWNALYSTQFELGPVGEASIGNVGHFGKSQSGAVDLVVTPLAGLGWQVGEDALDKHLVVRMERWTSNPVALVFIRSFLNPTRSFANAMRFRVPWSRDTRPGLFGKSSRSR